MRRVSRFQGRVGWLSMAAFAMAFLDSGSAFGLSAPHSIDRLLPGNHRAESPGTVQRARVLMGTMCTVIAEGPGPIETAHAVDEAFGEIDRLENVLSSWRRTSELSHVNAAGSERWIPCSNDFFAVLDSSLAIARETGGAFDPTVEPLNRIWDTRGAGRLPAGSELALARERVGWSMVLTEPGPQSVRFRKEGMGLDFGGIGKGYALDRAAEVLRARGVRSALLNFGGELVGFGGTDGWPIDIADPGDRMRPAVRLVMLHGAVSTSGQGERYITVKGHRYGHILDPRTGRPLETPASVTVVAPSGTLADGLSTGLLVMGREKAEAFIRAHQDVGALWLERIGDSIHAWRWNLPFLAAAADVHIEWRR